MHIVFERPNLFAFGICVIVVATSSNVLAQLPPMPPLFPRTQDDCQKFSEQVTKFYADMRIQHQKCLDDAAKFSKPTPESNQNSLICSQPSCQYLHDFVYGNKESEAQRKVEDCRKDVQENMRREADRKAESEKEEREYQERIEKRAAERKADADKLAAERAKRDAGRTQAEKEQTTSETQADNSSSSGESQVYSIPQSQPHSDAQGSAASHKPDSKPIKLADPYGVSAKAGGSSDASVVDPYGDSEVAGISPSVVDPYSSEAREETATSRVASEIRFNSGKKALEMTFQAGEKTLAADIENAPNLLSGKKLQAYLADANDLKGVIKGMGWMLEKSEYAVDAAAILKANTDEERTGAEAQLGITFTKDVATKGFSIVATKLFPEAAAVLSGPVGWAAFVGQQVLVPTEISRDPTEIIRDNSGHTSLAQKQEALFQMWKQYDKFGANWKEPQKIELLQNTEIVYQQANSGSH
jgi:hypothetical protein